MKKIALGLSACLAVAVITMGQVPVSITPGSANQVLAINGLATVPSISFSAQPGLGIYRASANVIGFANDGYASTPNAVLTTSGFVLAGTSQGFGFAPAADATTAADTRITRVLPGEFAWTAVAFASLGAPANGSFAYCSDCTVANPCAGAGTGALAKRLNGAWVCN